MDNRMNIELDRWLTRTPEEFWGESDDVVDDGSECPECGEARMDWLTWRTDEGTLGQYVHCETCGCSYDPETGESTGATRHV